MACSTKRDQVVFGVLTRMAAESFVVNFKIGHRAAALASPAIALQYLLAELFVRLMIKPQSGTPWANQAHDAFTVK